MKRFTLIIAILTVVSACQSQAGLTFTSVTRTEGDDKASHLQKMTVKAAVQVTQGKFEIEHSGNPLLPSGSYLLTKNGGATLQLVHPKTKTYQDLDIKSMAALAQHAANVTFANPKVQKVLDEDGPKILEYPTRHCKLLISYSIMGTGPITEVTVEEEVWICQKFNDIALGVMAKFTDFKTGNQLIDDLMTVEKAKLQGFALKSIVTTTTKNPGKNTPVSGKVETEITDIKETNIDASVFQVPADYKEDANAKDSSNKPAADTGSKPKKSVKSKE
jgi:hypothetical protein